MIPWMPFLADFAASGKTNNHSPFKANQHFAIQSLARQRKQYINLLFKEKTRILKNIFIKFSDYDNAKHQNKSFSNTFDTTSIEVLLNYKTHEDIANSSIEDLTQFIKEKSKTVLMTVKM